MEYLCRGGNIKRSTSVIQDAFPSSRLRPTGRKPYGLRRKSRKIPPYWQRVDTCAPTLPSNHTLRLWTLVLESRAIPFVQLSVGTRQQVYVPPLAAQCARQELIAFHAENARKPVSSPAKVHASGNWAVLFFVLLLLWHGTLAGWWSVPTFLPAFLKNFFVALTTPDGNQAVSLGGLDTFKMWSVGQWYRAVTALTLHLGSQHVLGNVAFGSLFVTLLCRRMGLGYGLLLVVLGGAVGNILNSGLRMYQSGAFVSIGFSTALFAAVGALAGSLVLAQAREDRRKAFVPLAAGGAILAMLGAEGDNLDYMAHVFGLLSGFGLGIVAQYLQNSFQPRALWQWLCAGMAASLLAASWMCTL